MSAVENFLQELARRFGFFYAVTAISEAVEIIQDPRVIGKFLAVKELEQLKSYKVDKRKIEWLAGRLAAKSAFVNFSESNGQACDFRDIVVKQNEHRAPFVQQFPEMTLSISHSYDLAVAVVAPYPIGVDVEKIDPRHAALVNYFCHPVEKKVLDDCRHAEQFNEKLTLLWSRKEAVSKFVRLGVQLNFKTIDASADIVHLQKPEASIRLFSASIDGYCLTLAIKGSAT